VTRAFQRAWPSRHLVIAQRPKGLGGGGVPGTTPTDISGLQLWLDASDISTLFQDDAKTTPVTADAQTVGAWADKSGSGNDATQSTADNEPTYNTGQQNGLPMITFDGTSDAMALSMTVGAGNYTFFAVLKDGTTGYIFDAETGRLIFGEKTAAPSEMGFFDGGWSQGGEGLDSDPSVYTWVLDNAGASMFKNGSALTLDDTGYTPVAIGGQVAIGSGFNQSSSRFNGKMGELVLYNAALSSANRGQVENYLAGKWGVTLS